MFSAEMEIHKIDIYWAHVSDVPAVVADRAEDAGRRVRGVNVALVGGISVDQNN
jgi:hypothetical protein